jgi:catechol 2,3-dioxygenase-like lactoylglutathione lyase family enzyme
MEPHTKKSLITGTHHLAIQTTDWEAALHLYRDVLGMTETITFDNGAGQTVMLLATGNGTYLELFKPVSHSPDPTPAAFTDLLSHLAFAVTDTRAATEQVRAAGYEILVEPRDFDAGQLSVTISFFRGSSGEIIELVEERTALDR